MHIEKKSDTVFSSSEFSKDRDMTKSEPCADKTEKQAEMLRHNLILRKKQIEERKKIAARKTQNQNGDGKELAPKDRVD